MDTTQQTFSPADTSVRPLLDLLENYEFVDLSHTLTSGIPTIPAHPKFILASYPSMGDPAEFNQLIMSDHSGTHMDSPAHFVPDQDDVRRIFTDQIPLDRLAGRAVKLTFGPFEADSHQIDVQDIREWEEANVTIEQGDIVLLDMQWSSHWQPIPEGFDYLRGWPGITGEAAAYLREQGVKAVGTDCISVDAGKLAGDELRAHYDLLPNGVLIMENLTNLENIPVVSFFLALPLRIGGGSGSPIRAVALVPKTTAAA
ncbi:cyclase family protein [Parafrigoribacterium mesophilum]|uniref:cyclase family protein n=1 Tax=Parafrigoribacterium mesophilum TaxID=433646 RepID=UPI0031FE29B2